MNAEGKKRLFILLGLLMLMVYGAVFALIWFLLSHQSPLLNKILLIGAIAAFVMFMLFTVLGLGILVYSLLDLKSARRFGGLNRRIVEFFYPAVSKMGHLLGIEQEAIENSYIKIVNQMTLATGKRFRPEEILILAPHCLQNTACPHKITIDVNNCHRCGQCSISGLLDIAEERGVHLVVASGGTFARKFARELKPRAIVAIACQRDLASGIQDLPQLPVLGVLNERPNGPCINTSVPLCKVQQAIDQLIDESL